MCDKNAMQLSLKGETFAALKEDFDAVLAKTIGNMEMKGANEATVTLKLSLSLEKVQNHSDKEITKPSFKHDISSVMQVKDKKSGALTGDYELVWDNEDKKWVMRRITDGQVSLFDTEKENVNTEPNIPLIDVAETSDEREDVIDVEFVDIDEESIKNNDSDSYDYDDPEEE